MELNYNKRINAFAKDLRRKSTLSEILLWNEIKDQKIGYKFNRQQPVGNYIVDFICRKERAVIEIDGDSHDGKTDYDDTRDKYLQEQKLIVIHIHDYDVKYNVGGVVKFIQDSIKTKTSSKAVTRY